MLMPEFIVLLSNIMGDTPLGNIIRIRSTTDPTELKNLSSGERRIIADWNKFLSKTQGKEIDFKSVIKKMI